MRGNMEKLTCTPPAPTMNSSWTMKRAAKRFIRVVPARLRKSEKRLKDRYIVAERSSYEKEEEKGEKKEKENDILIQWSSRSSQRRFECPS